MKFNTLIIFSIALLAIVDGQSNLACEEESPTFSACLQNNFIKSMDLSESALYSLEEKVNKCFRNQQCDKPEYLGPLESTVARNMRISLENVRRKWMSLPQNVKMCVKDSILDEAIENAKECLQRKELSSLFTTLHKDEIQTDLFHFLKEGPDAYSRLLNGIFRTTIALKQCRKEKGNTIALQVSECLGGVRKTIEDKMCSNVQYCEMNLTIPCRDKSENVRDALCSCQRDTAADVLTLIEKYQATKKDVSGYAFISDFKKIFINMRTSISANVTKCFDSPSREDRHFADDLATITTLLMNDPTGPARVFMAFMEADKRRYRQSELKFFHTTLTSFIDDCDCN